MESGQLCAWFITCAIAALVCFSAQTYAGLPGNETDHLALIEFKAKITLDPLGAMSSWNSSNHFCQWRGVTCGRKHRRVIVLNLRSLKLSGSISPYVGNLSFLRALRLHNNSFSHEIPSEIGRLHRLRVLGLANNSFGGEIPSNLSTLSNVMSFDLSFNQLVGRLPMELSSLSQVEWFNVQRNSLTGGISPSFGNLSHVMTFVLQANYLTGRVPEALGQLRELINFDIAGNNLSGAIPSSLYNISSIKYFGIGRNIIEGTLPQDLGTTLPNLSEMSIGLNRFTGSIPVSLSNATKLFRFVAPLNELTGKVPHFDGHYNLQYLSISFNYLGLGVNDFGFLSSLVNASALQLVAVNGNNLGGSLPESIGNLSTTLRILYLSSNQVSGTLPIGITNLVNLEGLYLFGNRFTGVLPTDIGMLTKLSDMQIQDNSFSGNILMSLGNISSLLNLNLGGNNFQGHIPTSIEKCNSLLYLNFSRNYLTGTIPKEVFGLASMSVYMDLSHNNLVGSIPTEVGQLHNLGQLDVSHNLLSGEIPGGLEGCRSLEILNMEQNFFQGTIPLGLSSVKGIKVLNLSQNNLTGQIPPYLQDLRLLEFLDLSFNDFEGKVPSEGVFRNASATSLTGNKKICGGNPEYHLPACIVKERNTWGSNLVVKLTAIICGIFGLVMTLSCLYLSLIRRKREVPAPGSSEALQLSYQSLLNATDGFSSSNLIGTGSFGSVYRGILADGTIVAVKLLNLLRCGASRSFLAECEAIKSIRHRNLVKIVTVCSGVDYQGNDFKALVYEFMANGNLEEWLHATQPTSDEEPRRLNFLQRLNIAVDVACALDYLHRQCHNPIAHCDLKPSNVLLDSDMTARIGDFGLAKFFSEVNPEFSKSQTSSIGVRGTVGYVAPEYGMGSVISASGDVYSYGILLLEMFTGKRPTESIFNEDLTLHKFVKTTLPDRVMEIMDPLIQLPEVVHVQDYLASILEIGVACSAESPQERRRMGDVAAELQAIRDRVLKRIKS